MSTLLTQVAESQIQSTPKRKRQRHPERTSICECGSPKERRAIRCRACKTKEGKPPEDPNVFFIEGYPCRRFPLTRGQYAIVDVAEYDRIDNRSFFAQWNTCTKSYYALTMQPLSGGRRRQIHVAMTTIVLNLLPGTLVDHINGDTLDNRRSNLRQATSSQNAMNRKVRSDCTSGYTGVSHVSEISWRAYIFFKKKQISVGCFLTAELAARARDVASLKHYGSFARLNFPELIGEYQVILATSDS